MVKELTDHFHTSSDPDYCLETKVPGREKAQSGCFKVFGGRISEHVYRPVYLVVSVQV